MKINQKGFSAVELIIVLVVMGVIGFVGYTAFQNQSKDDKKDSTSSSQSLEESTDEPDIELQNFGLSSLDSVEINKFAVSEYNSNGLKGFYVFGDKLSEGRTNPNFEFASLKDGTKVVAAIDGVIGFVKQQDGDFEVFLMPKDDSVWTIGYDHLVNVTVKQGDKVKAGDVLGEPAVQNNGLTRFEIQINKGQDDDTVHICPSTLLAASVKDKLLADLVAMQNSWESATGLELYDVSAQDPTGCLVKTLTPTQAEGS